MSRNAVCQYLDRISFVLLCAMPLLLAVTRAGADIAVSAIAVFFLIQCALRHDFSCFKKPELVAMLALWGYLVCQSLLLSDSSTALRSLAWLRFVLLYAAVTHWLLISPPRISLMAAITFVSVVLLLVDTYWQYFHGTSLSGRDYPHPHRLGGPMTHPNIANLLLKLSLPLAGLWAFYLIHRGKRHEYLLFAGFVVAAMAIVPISGERSSSLLMIMATVLVMAGIFWSNHKARWYVLATMSGFVLLMIILFMTQSVVQARAIQLAEQVINLADSVYGQLFIAAFHFWQTSPVFGLGAGEFKYACKPAMALLHTTYCDVHPHNIYLEWLSETGTIGAALFITAMGLVVKSVWQQRQSAPLMLWLFPMVALVVVLWPAIVTQSIFSNWPAMLFWYSLSIAAAAPRYARRYVH
ncbi:MAG: O-antigen ligase family protein [Alphaproteobacteria bacterium]|nr:O-antigen ligase family protein [Alphaproteobacteria bacterium]